jgi:hypothetical protein
MNRQQDEQFSKIDGYTEYFPKEIRAGLAKLDRCISEEDAL